MRSAFSLVLVIAAALTATGCKSEQSDSDTLPATETVRTEQWQGGATVVETIQASAIVTSVDNPSRRVGLRLADGSTRTVTAGPNVTNFNQIKVNDKVRLTVTEETALFLSNGAAPSASETTTVAIAPSGGGPAAAVANTASVTAQITAINTQTRTVTLMMPGGATRRVKAGPQINLDKLTPGQDVTARITESVALSVTPY